MADYLKTGDANDMLYALEASRDYDPGPGLEKIRAPLVAINFADDLINPPELGNSRARDQARAERPRGDASLERQDARARQPHDRGVWKSELEAFAERIGETVRDSNIGWIERSALDDKMPAKPGNIKHRATERAIHLLA